MLKVFDKVVSQAPYLCGSTSVENIQKKYLSALYILLFVSFINFGLVLIVQYITAYSTAWFLVWCYRFINKNIFFNTYLWNIAICTYTLFLPPQISIIQNIICVMVLVIFGAGILSIQGRYLINPVLLGLITIFILNVSHQKIITLPYLLPLLYKQYMSMGEGSLLQTFLDANLIVVGWSEQTLLYKNSVSTYNAFITLYNDLYRNNNFSIASLLSTPYSSYLGFNSLIVLWGVYLYLIAMKLVKFAIPVLYVLVFYLVYSILNWTIFPPILLLQNTLLWGVAIMLFNDKVTQPNTKTGQYLFAILTAILSGALFARYLNEFNHMFALIIMSLFSSFIELITKLKPFSYVNNNPIQLSNVSNTNTERTYTIKGIMFSFMVLVVWMFSFLFSGNVLQKQESSYFQAQILKLFSDKIVQVKTLQPDIFEIIDNAGKYGIVVYTQNTINRIRVELFILVQDRTIQDIEILNLRTAHSYQLNKLWKTYFIGLNVSQLNSISLKKTEESSKNILLQKTLDGAVLQLTNYPIDLLTNNKKIQR